MITIRRLELGRQPNCHRGRQHGRFQHARIASDISVSLNTPLTIGNMIFGDTNSAAAALGSYHNHKHRNRHINTQQRWLDTQRSPSINSRRPQFDDAFMGHNIAGTMGFNKLGSGILTLRGPVTTNTITGGININAGTLRLNAAIPGQAITIGNGATVQTAVTLDAGTPAPGHQINVEPGATANHQYYGERRVRERRTRMAQR